MVFLYCCLPISRANSCENVLESHPCGCICTSNCASLSSKSVLSGSCGSCGSLQTYHWPESCHILPMFLFCCQFRISCSGMFSFSTSLESFLGSLSFFDLPRRQRQKMFQPYEFAEPLWNQVALFLILCCSLLPWVIYTKSVRVGTYQKDQMAKTQEASCTASPCPWAPCAWSISTWCEKLWCFLASV